MYIVNNIAYAGEPVPVTRVLSARPLDGYKLLIVFNGGITKVFDFEPLLNMPCFVPLKDKNIFSKVYVDYGCTVWNNGEIDIAPEKLFGDGIPYIDNYHS